MSGVTISHGVIVESLETGLGSDIRELISDEPALPKDLVVPSFVRNGVHFYLVTRTRADASMAASAALFPLTAALTSFTKRSATPGVRSIKARR